MLMGSVPSAIPACLDCGAYFWLGVIVTAAIGVVLALGFAHYRKGK